MSIFETTSLIWYGDRIQSAFDRGAQAAVVEATILVYDAAKGRVPVDTGALRDSIEMSYGLNEGEVSTRLYYAPYVEYGTANMSAQPFLQPALDENRLAIEYIFKRNIKAELGE